MARIILRAPSLEALQRQARRASDILARSVAHTGKTIKIIGPLPPPIARISGHHRLHFILRSATASALQAVLARARSELFKLPVHLAIDMDPVNLL